MLHLSRHYYTFKMREKVRKFVKMCAVCALHRISPSHKEDDGNQIATEPNDLMVIDIAGPYHGYFLSSSGAAQYCLVAIDAFSRFSHCIVLSSANDNEVFRALLEIRRHISGLPARISADNALLRENSKARKFLEENNVRIIHGLPHVSRCQSKAERAIGTISRFFIKYHTSSPNTPFKRLVDEAVLTYNSTSHEGLPNGMTPRDAHFVTAPRSFLRAKPEVDAGTPPSIRATMEAIRAAKEDILRNDALSYMRRQTKRSPTNFTARLKKGDYALQRRTSFPASAPKKLFQNRPLPTHQRSKTLIRRQLDQTKRAGGARNRRPLP